MIINIYTYRTMPRGRSSKMRRSMTRGGGLYGYCAKGTAMSRYEYWLSKIKKVDINLYNDMKNKPPRDNIQTMHTVFNDCKISKDLTDISLLL